MAKTALDPIDILQSYVDVLRRLQRSENYIPKNYAFSLSVFRKVDRATWKDRSYLEFAEQCNTTHVGTAESLVRFVKHELAKLDTEAKDPESEVSKYKAEIEAKAKERRRQNLRVYRMRCYYKKKEMLNQQNKKQDERNSDCKE